MADFWRMTGLAVLGALAAVMLRRQHQALGWAAAAFDYALERMTELCRRAEQKRDAQSRLFASLGALSGVCALMILW